MSNIENVEEKLNEYFQEDIASSIATILITGSRYSEGDAFSGTKLERLSQEDWNAINEHFQEAGFDVSINSKMGLVGFVNSPDTDDEELNELIKKL